MFSRNRNTLLHVYDENFELVLKRTDKIRRGIARPDRCSNLASRRRMADGDNGGGGGGCIGGVSI